MTTFNLDDLIAPMLATHRSGVNHTLEWRLHQLRTLQLMLDECEHDLCAALHRDLRKERTEARYSELLTVRREIRTFVRNLPTWMAPERVATPAAFVPSTCEILSVPLSEPGVLVIGPFNYPVGLALMAAVGAFGGGNPVVFKPSELAPAVSALFAKIVPKYFEKGAFQIVEGGVAETTRLMTRHWGMVHFTGSERVGTIIQRSAASTLSPTVLELGGKAPAIVAADCPDDMAVVCNRLLSGKLLNAGQACVSPDYALVHESKVPEFAAHAVAAIARLCGPDPAAPSSELGRMVTVAHAERLVALIAEVERGAPEKVLCGGSAACAPRDRFVAPTLLLDPAPGCRVLREEIFGPVLPIVTYRDDAEAIALCNRIAPTPLALYVFTKSQRRYERFMRGIPSGSAMRNDTVLQLLIRDFPFGGIGTSGIGSYHGKASFTTFTHRKTSQSHACHAAAEFCGLRYHPHGGDSLRAKTLLFAVTHLPDVPAAPWKLLSGLALLGLALAMHGPGGAALRGADLLEAAAAWLRRAA